MDAKEAKDFNSMLVRKCCKELKREAGRPSLRQLLSLSAGDKKKTGRKLSIDDMSDPTGFQHLIHIGFNPLTGAFEPRNVPPEWADFFRKAGLSANDLTDRSTAACVAQFVSASCDGGRAEPKAVPVPPAPPGPSCNAAGASPEDDAASTGASIPPPAVPADRADLMASIRSSRAHSLRPVAQKTSSGEQTDTAEAGSDLMASMLARALAERKQKTVGTCAHSPQ